MDLQFIILLCILIFFTVIGYIRGLIKSVVKIVLIVFTFIIAYVAAPIVGQIIIDRTDINDKIETIVSEKIATETKKTLTQAKNNANSDLEKYLKDNDIDTLKIDENALELNRNEQMEIINNINMPDFVKKSLIENSSKEFMQKIGANNFCEYIAKYVSYIIVKLLAFIGLFVFISLISLIIYIAVGGLAKLPILHGVDKAAGAVFGLAEGLIVCGVIILLMDCITSVMTDSTPTQPQGGKTVIDKISEQEFVQDIMDDIIRIE